MLFAALLVFNFAICMANFAASDFEKGWLAATFGWFVALMAHLRNA